MPQNIRTKWHKIIPMIEAEQVYLPANEGINSIPWAKVNSDFKMAKAFLTDLGKMPKYFIEDELMGLATKENFQRSLLDLHKAGRLRLPYPAMIVEFELPDREVSKGRRGFVMLRDNNAPEASLLWERDKDASEGARNFYARPFYGYALRIESDHVGEYLVAGAAFMSVELEEREGEPWLGVVAEPHNIIPKNELITKNIEQTWQKDISLFWRALLGAVLLSHTEGVVHDIVDCAKLNKHRLAKGKPPVPRHTILRIGRIYRGEGDHQIAEDYIPRRSPAPHWRSGHNRTVRYGKGHTKSYIKWINPRIVALKPGDTLPEHKQYIAKK